MQNTSEPDPVYATDTPKSIIEAYMESIKDRLKSQPTEQKKLDAQHKSVVQKLHGLLVTKFGLNLLLCCAVEAVLEE